MDTAILVSDCSRRGVQAAARIAELIHECDMKPKTIGLIVNRAPGGVLNEGTREEIEKQGLHLLGVVPHDDTVYEYDCDGKPTVTLPGKLTGARGAEGNCEESEFVKIQKAYPSGMRNIGGISWRLHISSPQMGFCRKKIQSFEERK